MRVNNCEVFWWLCSVWLTEKYQLDSIWCLPKSTRIVFISSLTWRIPCGWLNVCMWLVFDRWLEHGRHPADTTWNSRKRGSQCTPFSFLVKRKSIPSHCHWVHSSTLCCISYNALVDALAKFASSVRVGQRERERQPRVNLPWLDSNWMRRISSVLIGRAVMAEQQCVLWQLRLSSSHQCWRTSSLAGGCHPHHLHSPDAEGGGTSARWSSSHAFNLEMRCDWFDSSGPVWLNNRLIDHLRWHFWQFSLELQDLF